MADIHPTAIIDPTAQIADSVRIGPYCVIGPEVVIDHGTVLHNHVTIQSMTVIGEENVVYPFSVIGADAQDRKYRGERASCFVGNKNSIREHVTIHRGTQNGGGVTRIGSDNLIMVAAHVAHDCQIGSGVCIANQVMLAGHVQVEDGANIGGGAGIHHYATIGTCSMVGGLARIVKDVPPFMIVEGNPADVRGVNDIAMSRRGYSPEHVEAVKDAYKRLYRNNGVMAEKIDELLADCPDVPAIQRLCNALVAAASGIHGRSLELHRRDDKRSVEITTSPIMSSLPRSVNGSE